MVCALFNGNLCTTIVSCYGPTNASDEMDIITIYNALSSLVLHIPKHNVWIIRGDMNAYIGKDGDYKFCIHNSPNRNDEYRADFSDKNRLAYLKTKFKEKKNGG